MIKRFLKKTRKFFNWLWSGKSLTSHVAFLIVAYLVLKFLAYPAFLWIFGLNDVVAVLSNSMNHGTETINHTFNDWLTFHGFNESTISSWPLINGLGMGDVVTVLSGDIKIGDVIVYYHGRDLIIHRVINITEAEGNVYFTTKGDANPAPLVFESLIPISQVKGKAGLYIPFLGWPRVLLYYVLGF